MQSSHDLGKRGKVHIPGCPKKFVIGTQATPCNLRYPKCLVWDVNNHANGLKLKSL